MSAAGMAGNSAEEVARQAREKAERLLRRAEAFERGAEGERIVSALLAQLPREWFVLDDLHWPGRDRANIDHVVVGPTGVFVIDAKNWSGTVTVSKGVLRQNGYSRAITTEGAVQAAKAVGSVIPTVDPRLVVPVVCFVGDASTTGTVDGVEVCTAATLLKVLQSHPVVLSDREREFIRFDLDMSTDNARQSTAHRRAPVTLVTSPAKPPGHPSSRTNGHSKVARVLLSVLAWWIGCAVTFWILGPISHYQANVVAPAELVIGGVCGVIAWRRLSARRARSVGSPS